MKAILLVWLANVALAFASRPFENGVQIAAAPAYYPRGTTLSTGDIVAAVETPNATSRRLSLFAATTNGSWVQRSVIASDNNLTANPDLANPFVFEYQGRLLCAYRHHTGVGTARVFRIHLSVSLDGGATWAGPVTAIEGATGVWEPFLYMYSEDVGTLRLVYAAELTNGGEQDIVSQHSNDGGNTWSGVVSRIHTDGSRNGMPGVVELPDASLVAIFEGFWAGLWGWYTVNHARSFDGGLTWPQRSIVHQPNFPFDSGSPQVGLCNGSRICAIYMSNEDGPAVAQWPAGAHIAATCTSISTANESAPLLWNASAPVVVPTTTSTAYWPGLFVDQQGLQITYQTPDGDAETSAATFC